jgi:predicted Zn-dependent protease
VRHEPALPDDRVNVTQTHPLSDAAVLFLGLIVLSGAAFAALALIIDALVPLVPVEREMAVFGSLGEQMTELADDLDSPRARRIDALVQRLVRGWEDCPYRFVTGIVESPDPNAMALPGGVILVTSALIEQAESENELAFVLAHELGHFHHRDHLRGLGRGLGFAIVTGLVTGSSGIRLPSLVGRVRGLTDRSFSRKQEARADAFGLVLLQGEYGHVAGSLDFFARLAEEESGDGRASGVVRYLRTHPLSDHRVQELERRAAHEGWSLSAPLRPVSPVQPTPAEDAVSP